MEKFIVELIAILAGITIGMGIAGLIFWGIGNFIIWAFGISFIWTYWHGLATAIILQILRNIFWGKVQGEK